MLVTVTALTAKERNYSIANYGVNYYQSQSGSGFGANMNFNLNVQHNNRVFELGFLLDRGNQEFKGVEFVYKHFMGFYHNFNNKTTFGKIVKPYFYYNFLYHSPTDVVWTQSRTKSASLAIPAEGKVTSFEHAVGLGLQFRITNPLFVETSAGFGAYLGSKYQGDAKPSTVGIHKDNYGFVPSFHLGIGYQF